MRQLITPQKLRRLIAQTIDIKIDEYKRYGTYVHQRSRVASLQEDTDNSAISMLELQYLIDEEFTRAIEWATKGQL